MPPAHSALDALPSLKFQPHDKIFCVETDTLLLAAFACPVADERWLDLGTGCGALALFLAAKKRVSVTGVDVQVRALTLAQNYLKQNAGRLRGTAQFFRGDIRRWKPVDGRRFDGVVCNPPYYPPRAGRLPPSHEKALARHSLRGDLKAFARSARRLLRPGGQACWIVPATRLGDLLEANRAAALEPKALLPVYTIPTNPAELVLLRTIKDGQPGLTLLPPLVPPWPRTLRPGEARARMAH